MPLYDERDKRQKRSIVNFSLRGTIALGERTFNCFKCNKRGMPIVENLISENVVKCPHCGTTRDISRNLKGTGTRETGYFVLRRAPTFAQVYGEKPTEIEVTFPIASLEKSIKGEYVVWGASWPLCRGDGRNITAAQPLKTWKDDSGKVHVGSDDGKELIRDGIVERPFKWGDHSFAPGDTVPCPGKRADMYPHCSVCKANVELRIAPTTDSGIYEFGWWKLTSTSTENYNVIEETIQHCIKFFGDAFTLIPFTLRLVEKNRGYFDADENKRKMRNHYYLELIPPPEVSIIIRRMMYENFVKTGQLTTAKLDIPALPAGEERVLVEDDSVPDYVRYADDEGVFEGEYYESEQETPEVVEPELPAPESAPITPMSVAQIQEKYVDLWNRLKAHGVTAPMWSKVREDMDTVPAKMANMATVCEALDAGKSKEEALQLIAAE